MLTVVSYDVVDDRRRAALSAWLAGFGTRVQLSVFECDLEPAQRARMQAGVAARIDVREDSVLVYTLCHTCARRIHSLPARAGAHSDVVV